MKIGIIPDVHGNPNVKQKLKVLEENNVSKVIILGDYFDSYDASITATKQIDLLKDLIDYKAQNTDKCDILLGNHDISYLTSFWGDSRTSGHQFYAAAKIQQFLLDNIDQFRLVSVYDNWIFSHAGVSSLWLQSSIPNYLYEAELNEKVNFVNNFAERESVALLNHCSLDPYGNFPTESCCWIRPPSLILFGIENYNQCVGHSPLDLNNKLWGISKRVISKKEYLSEAEKEVSSLQRLHAFYELPDSDVDGFLQRSLKSVFCFLDSENNSLYGIVDTETNQIVVGEVK